MQNVRSIIAAAILVASAWAAPAAAQASARAEITLPNATSATVRSQLVNTMMSRGYAVVNESQSVVAFEKPADNMAAMFLFGTRANMVPVSRVSFSMAEIGGNTRVMADIAVIANAGTAFERRNDLNFGADRDAAQGMLNGLSTASAPTPGLNGEMPRRFPKDRALPRKLLRKPPSAKQDFRLFVIVAGVWVA
jgi:hypothetical protein